MGAKTRVLLGAAVIAAAYLGFRSVDHADVTSAADKTPGANVVEAESTSSVTPSTAPAAHEDASASLTRERDTSPAPDRIGRDPRWRERATAFKELRLRNRRETASADAQRSQWHVDPALRAIPARGFESRDDLIVVKSMGGWLIVQPTSESARRQVESGRAVVRDALGRTGVYTGIMRISYETGVNVERIVQDHGLKFISKFNGISEAFVEAPWSPEVLDGLRKDSRVKTVEFDILKNGLKTF